MITVASLSREVVQKLEEALKNIGIMYRIFPRIKEAKSLQRKIDSDPRYGKEKLIQDGIGIRIVLYFVDDVDIVRNVVSNLFKERSESVSIDDFDANEFRAKRYNIVYELGYLEECPLKKELGDKVDSTFELQIRTLLSEGWHEVEHDLRYKFAPDWHGFKGLSRGMNGVLASLETNEWTMVRILDDLSYGHYKAGNIVQLLRQKLRLRIISYELDSVLESELLKPRNLKKCQRLDRGKLLMQLSKVQLGYPVNLTNILYFANLTQLHIPEVTKLIPVPYQEEINEALASIAYKDNMVGVELARSIAEFAHLGQFRRNGLPYITHPESVVELVKEDDEKCAAWLHDVVEDTDITIEDLADRGVNSNILDAVRILTKADNENYDDYISRIKNNPIARRVKIADILHNLSDDPTEQKIDKYVKALSELLKVN